MKIYRWSANFHWREDPHVPITTFTAITRGEPVHADSEDQARDRVEEMISDKYGKVWSLKLWVYEVEA